MPLEVEPEHCVEFYFDVSEFKAEIAKMIELKHIKKNQKFVVFVTDALGDSYFCKTNIKVGQLIK